MFWVVVVGFCLIWWCGFNVGDCGFDQYLKITALKPLLGKTKPVIITLGIDLLNDGLSVQLE